MLCFQHAKLGEICTIRCTERSTCTKQKVSLLIYGIEDLFFKSESETSHEKQGVSYYPYCSAPDIRLHWIIDNESADIMTEISCANPYCSNLMKVPQESKIEWEDTNYKKYGKKFRPCCSKECQERVEVLQAESKFYTTGTLKNHDRAQWLKGVDSIKRFKTEEPFLLHGNKTEIRAKLLYIHLSLMKTTEKKLTSSQVKRFLLEELPDEYLSSAPIARLDTSRVMKKSKELFGDSISIGKENEKEMNIELINILL